MSRNFGAAALKMIPEKTRKVKKTHKAVQDIEVTERKRYLQFKRLLNSLDARVKENWASIISSALAAGITEDDIRLEIGASPSTIHRWMKNEAAPREGTRKLIKSALEALIEDKLNEKQNKKLGRLTTSALEL